MRPASSFLFIQLSNSRTPASIYMPNALDYAAALAFCFKISSLTHSKRKKRYNR